jgi:hypothetical protein
MANDVKTSDQLKREIAHFMERLKKSRTDSRTAAYQLKL